jgi:acetamidase/formamidase
MLDLLAGTYNISRLDAFALASVAVDLRITQIVNHLCGCHALLPHRAIRI